MGWNFEEIISLPSQKSIGLHSYPKELPE